MLYALRHIEINFEEETSSFFSESACFLHLQMGMIQGITLRVASLQTKVLKILFFSSIQLKFYPESFH